MDVAVDVKLAAVLLLLWLVGGAPSSAEAAVFKVGDSVGWTIVGSPNYTAWAISKIIHVGDTIVFEYNKNFHNVMEVSKADYAGCSAASPMHTWATGNDSISVKTAGHHYYLCGVPSHCGLGQKVDIRASKAGASSAAPSTAPAPAAALPGSNSGAGASSSFILGAPASSPKPNAAANAGFPVGFVLPTALASLAFLEQAA